MKKFLASPWFTLFICVIMAAATTVAFVMIYPESPELPRALFDYMNIVTAATGPLMGISSLALVGVLTTLQHSIINTRKNHLIHPLIIIASVAPWFAVGQSIPNTIYHLPLMWGSFIATLTTSSIVLSFITFYLPQRRS